MAESMSGKSFREIAVPAGCNTRWKEIVVNTGASASTLQDIKVSDSCGGYAYLDSGISQSPVRNRFIYWRTNNDVLELIEESLDFNLIDCHVRYRFHDTPILGGISVHEAHGNVVILVATVASVHRLVFPHPVRLQRNDLGYTSPDQPVQSIFFNASIVSATDPTNIHMLNPGGSITSQLYSAASYLTNEGEALFTFSSNMGNISLIRMPPPGVQGIVQQFELSQSTMMQKLWTGLVPSSMRGGQEATDAATSLIIHLFRGDAYIFAVCRDHKLRIWSTKTRECVSVFNLLECCPDSQHLQSQPITGTGHTISKVLNCDATNLKFCVFLNFTDRKHFCFVQPQLVSGRIQIFHNATVFGPPEDLIDYCVTEDYLWTLWTNKSGESVARVHSVYGGTKGDNWMDVVLQPPEVTEMLVPSHRDPREVYMERIFHPGHFSLLDIQKALNVYRRSLDTTAVPSTTLQINTLKEEVTLAVESAIKTLATANEMDEEEYCQLQLDQWTKFYSCCVQYQEVGSKMKGIFADAVTGLVCFIKKGNITYVRPCDKIEDLYLSGHWPETNEYSDDWAAGRDLNTVGMCLTLIEKRITEDIAAQFDYQLYMNEDVQVLAGQIVEELFYDTSLVEGTAHTDTLGALIQTVHDLPAAIRKILSDLDLSQQTDDIVPMDDSEIHSTQVTVGHLFTSSTANEILTASLQQMSHTRLSALRDLLILQMSAMRLGDKDGMTHNICEALRDLVPFTEKLIRSYLVLRWATNTVAVQNQANSLEFNMRQLATLEITDSSGIHSHLRTGLQNVTVTEMFIRGIGGTQARSALANERLLEDEPCQTWSIALLALTKSIAKLIWPLSDGFLFPEFLVSCCQYLPLQEYVHLQCSWCDCNSASRKFMLGLSYLYFDESQKAAKCFIEASEGVSNDSYLRHKLLQTDEEQVRKLEVLYYLKVIKQFEEFGAPDVVVSLAKTAIGIADDDDLNVATLWSKVFKYQLELGHNEQAYNAMIANPDPSRRKDCLRQLLVTLCERGDLQSVVKFPYSEIEDEVVSILESRARSVDLSTHNYYDLLYAFHVYRNNFRKAGSVMYEHGMRLGREVMGRRGLQRQAQCYLAAMNALRLVNPDYAWIVKPVQPKSKNVVGEFPSQSTKHFLNGEEKSENVLQQKVEILELSDIEKEFMLVDARLRLIRKDNVMSSGPTPGQDEMVGLLVNAGMYDRAVILCRVFDLKLNSVFESLALRCVNLAKTTNYIGLGENAVVSQAWEWLQENNLTLSHVSKESSASDLAWSLLQQYLERYEEQFGRYHRCTATKLLSHGFPLPTWLINSYKALNMAELLRIYIGFDLLEEAVSLVLEYLDARMESFHGQDSEIFKLKGCLKPTCQGSWLPYTSIDQLLVALRDHRDEISYGNMYEALQNQLMIYQRKIRSLSEEISKSQYST